MENRICPDCGGDLSAFGSGKKCLKCGTVVKNLHIDTLADRKNTSGKDKDASTC